MKHSYFSFKIRVLRGCKGPYKGPSKGVGGKMRGKDLGKGPVLGGLLSHIKAKVLVMSASSGAY